MGMSKTKKAIIALQERVNTIELNGDMIEKALGKESYEETVKCKDEIKTLLETYEKQSEFIRNTIRNAKKKILNQRNTIKMLKSHITNKKENRRSENEIIDDLAKCLNDLQKTGKYRLDIDREIFTNTDVSRTKPPFVSREVVGSKTIIVIREGRQVSFEIDASGVKVIKENKHEY